jgi:hypothetical protein
VRAEPAALAAISPTLAQNQRSALEARIRHLAARLGYELVDVVDVDTVPDLAELVRQRDVDAVITPTTEHLPLAAIARLCEVITVVPEAMHWRDGHFELLNPGSDQGSCGADPRRSASAPNI